jgi:hypothetical protein
MIEAAARFVEQPPTEVPGEDAARVGRIGRIVTGSVTSIRDVVDATRTGAALTGSER